MLDPDRVAQLVREAAAAEILPRFRRLGAGDIQQKTGPTDLVTQADRGAEAWLTRAFNQADPQALVLGEEAAALDPGLIAGLSGDRPLWVLDPVDGTINFAHGRVGFGCIVARIEQGRCVAGWIHDPLSGAMAMAVAGQGARLDGRLPRLAQGLPVGGLIGAAYDEPPTSRATADRLLRPGGVKAVANSMAGAMDYLSILRGETHFMLSVRSLVWDHAAGMLLIAEAGGATGFLDGSAYDPRRQDGRPLVAPDRAAWQALRGLLAA